MLINVIGFNLSWLGLVLLGNGAIPLVMCWLIFHIYQSKAWRQELSIILLVMCIGILVDSTLTWFNVFNFSSTDTFIPLWLIVLWAAFGATIYHSLSFLRFSFGLQVVVGFIFPALSYLAGASFSVVTLPYGQLVTYFILAPIWALLFIIFYKSANFLAFKGERYVD